MYEIKTEILEICEAFNLGSFINSKTIENAVGFTKTQFKTTKGTYYHFYKIKNEN